MKLAWSYYSLIGNSQSFTETGRLSKDGTVTAVVQTARPTIHYKIAENNGGINSQSVTAGGSCRCTRYGSGHDISSPVPRTVGVGRDAGSIQLAACE
jgi:hypothetical protein